MFQIVLICLICFISTILGTNSPNSADVPLSNKQKNQQPTKQTNKQTNKTSLCLLNLKLNNNKRQNHKWFKTGWSNQTKYTHNTRSVKICIVTCILASVNRRKVFCRTCKITNTATVNIASYHINAGNWPIVFVIYMGSSSTIFCFGDIRESQPMIIIISTGEKIF